jgi:hypothetical protein
VISGDDRVPLLSGAPIIAPTRKVRIMGSLALSREARVLLRDRSNSIRGFAELLAEDPGLTTRNRRFLMHILTSINRLLIELDREVSDRPSDRAESREGVP